MPTEKIAPETPTLDAATALGPVRLVVGDRERMRAFYASAIGLAPLPDAPDGAARLGVEGLPLVELVHRPDAPARPPRTTGLFHLAILVPGRAELARAVRRVVDAGWRFQGASDHLVSEAMYLADPEGNGIELYRDRRRDEWGWQGDEVAMDTLPVDLDGLMAEEPADDDHGMAPGTRIGHVHLQVSTLPGAEAFWVDAVGFDVVARSYPGALFVSAGRYHHHLGLNAWAGVGAAAPPRGARGLERLTIELASAAERDAVLARVAAAGHAPEEVDGLPVVRDASGNAAALAVRG